MSTMKPDLGPTYAPPNTLCTTTSTFADPWQVRQHICRRYPAQEHLGRDAALGHVR
jgi:hypothetical protein